MSRFIRGNLIHEGHEEHEGYQEHQGHQKYKGKGHTNKDWQLKKEYIADVVCYNQIIVELKAIDRLSGKEEAQALNYLKATSFRIGLLINFGSIGKLEWKRLIR